ncbi:Asp-tRNAAsn/Glu-tRNAGln amidotransferase A subunit [Klenkia marina]|uniref:Asp-tRNAAsn/Glu-tRNAGln amidotransferase A subunit n=1 Tax=Klenkia marina TaxID=1960309 RepID=A0A1G4YM01_9ACTN|nr:amidase [Klenkia marina]SCX54512.1 Asp-tRNAAsn/Glu-tRNAGln amidotransferase A subunit [Klenkia marina]
MSRYAPWSLVDLVADLRTGRTTPADAVARSVDRIAATEAQVRAWVGEVRAPDPVATGPLGGVPMGIKDIVDLAGWPTRCGSVLRADDGPVDVDAEVVTAWRAAGGLPLGKTVTTEFAYFAPGPTDNPAAPGHTPGGSSSGSAAAVAAGQVPLATGSQTAGSVTRPAAYCGVASLVLSRGGIGDGGVVGLAPSLDSHGILAAGVADVALAWAALLGVAVPAPVRPRVLVWGGQSLGPVDPAMAAALDRAEAALRGAGATTTRLTDDRWVLDAAAAHPVVMAYEAAGTRAAELARADRLSEPLAALLRIGAATTGDAYAAARAAVAASADRLGELLAGHDVLLCPAAPGPAPAGHAATGDPLHSRPWQAIGAPQVGVPALRAPDGRPLGLQVVGRPGADDAALAAAAWVGRHLS